MLLSAARPGRVTDDGSLPQHGALRRLRRAHRPPPLSLVSAVPGRCAVPSVRGGPRSRRGRGRRVAVMLLYAAVAPCRYVTALNLVRRRRAILAMTDPLLP